jgi:hypothetical protein
MRGKHLLLSRVLVVALACSAAGSAAAQTGVYGEIVGKAVDSSGGALPGVTVTVTGSNELGTKTATTDADGKYRFPALATGNDYQVQFELGGFATVARKSIAVEVRQTTTLDITMQVASLSESVTVVAQASTVDTTSARAGMSLRSDLLQEIPSAKDSSAILNLVAGSYRQNLNVGGSSTDLVNNIISNGTTQRNMNINGAETRAGSGDGRYNNYDAYEEINVESGAAGADTRRPGGGLSAEMVAKSGGNDFHGLLQGFWYNHNLVGDNLSPTLRAQGVSTGDADVQSLHQNTAQMGGPVMRNRIWWFTSFGDYHVFRKVIGQTHIQEGRLTPYLLNTTYQISPNQKLTLFYSAVPKIQKERAMSKFVDFLASEDQETKGTLRQAKWLGTFGTKTVAEGGFFTFKYWWPSNPQAGAGAPYNDTALGTFTHGFMGTNNIRNNHRSEGNFAVTRFLPDFLGGSNNVKVGSDLFYMYFRQDNFVGLGPDQEVLYQFANGAPTFATLYSGPARALRGAWSNSYFVQEQYQVGRLTVNTGFRYDHYRGFLPPQASEPSTRWESLFPPQVYPAVNSLIVWNTLSPRINGVIKLTKSGTQVIKASYGAYPSEYDPITESDLANGNSLRSRRYQWLGDLNGDGLLELNELGTLRSTTNPGTTTIQPGFKNPTTKEASVSYEAELPGKIAFRTQYFYSWYINGETSINVAQPRSAYTAVPYLDPGPDGKVGTADDKQITVYSLDPSVITLSQIQHATTPGTWKRSHAFSVSVQKRLADSFQILTSYTRNHVRQDGLADPNNPNANINNLSAVSPLESPNNFKLSGTYMLPFGGLQLSGVYGWQNGLPYNRVLNVTGLPQGQFTIIADPQGTFRYDNVNSLDIRIQKQLKLAKGQQIGLMLEGYNMFNDNASTDSDGPGIGTVTGGNFGVISKIMPARTWRLGARYTF